MNTINNNRVQRWKEWLPWGLGVLIVLVGIGTAKQALKRHEIQQEIDAMSQSVTNLQSKNGQLLQLLTYVKSPAHTEEQARLQFGFVKPGEHVAVIPGNVLGANAATRTSGGEAQIPQTNNWKWWSYFFPAQ